MKFFESPLAMLWLVLGVFVFIEGLHMIEHGHCRTCPPIEREEY